MSLVEAPESNQPVIEEDYETRRLAKAAATRAANKLKREAKAAADKAKAAEKRKVKRTEAAAKKKARENARKEAAKPPPKPVEEKPEPVARKEAVRIEKNEELSEDDGYVPGATGFARLKYTVEKKRALIAQHIADLKELELELQIRCGHYDVEVSFEDRPGDMYTPTRTVKILTCKTCGLKRDSQR